MKYTVHEAEIMMRDNFREMKREYTRMRDIAQKRIKRLAESEFTGSEAYKSHRQGFKKISDIDRRDFAKEFSDLSKFISAKGGSVSGQRSIRQKTMQRFQEQGIDVNKSNYDYFIRVLNEMRSQKLVYGSDTAKETADLMMTLEQKGYSVDEIVTRLSDLLPNYHRFSEIEDYVDDMPVVSRTMDFDELLEKIGW